MIQALPLAASQQSDADPITDLIQPRDREAALEAYRALSKTKRAKRLLSGRVANDTIKPVERARAGVVNPQVYVETSVVGYLTARPSRDVVTLGNQLATQAWWLNAPGRFDLVVSELVLQEVAAGDPTAARDRLAAVASLPVLAFDKESVELGRHLIQSHAIPSDAEQDAAHVAIAAVNRVDYLATWNLRHIANPRLIPLIDKSCRDRGYVPAMICTPSQLQEA